MTARPLAAAALALGAVLALVGGAPATAAPTWRSVEVLDVAGDVQDAGCIGPVEYTAGQVRITSTESVSPTGSVTTSYRVRTVGLTAVALDSGLVYKDVTSVMERGHDSPTWTQADLADGSHGVRIVERVRLFAPGHPDAPSLRATWDFRIQRAHGYDVDPVVVADVTSSTCG